MTAMGEIVWAIDPEIVTALSISRDVCAIRRGDVESGGVSLTFAVPETFNDLRLAVKVRRDLYLVFKEATNNAARHSGCSCYRVEVRRHRRCCRSPWSTTAADSARDAHGNGLSNMRRRSARLGGELTVRSAPGRGTAVILVLLIGGRIPLIWVGDSAEGWTRSLRGYCHAAPHPLTPPDPRLKVVIVEDERDVREGLALLIHGTPGFPSAWRLSDDGGGAGAPRRRSS